MNMIIKDKLGKEIHNGSKVLFPKGDTLLEGEVITLFYYKNYTDPNCKSLNDYIRVAITDGMEISDNLRVYALVGVEPEYEEDHYGHTGDFKGYRQEYSVHPWNLIVK
jgi:hypothetical protein